MGFLLNSLVAQLLGNAHLRMAALYLFLVLSSVAPLSAGETLLPVFHFNRLTTAEGLPSNNILSCVVRDSRGYVWIGTGNGLARYDGYGFKTYRNILNDSTSLSSSMILMVKEDSRHRLWVGTYDAGLSLYDPVRDRFVNFRPRPGDSTWLQTRAVVSMFEDSTGVLWLGTATGKAGIVRVELPMAAAASDIDSLGRGIRFSTYALGTPRNSANDLSMHSDGRILVASDSGLLFFDRRTGTVSRPDFPGPHGRRLNSVLMWRLIQDHSANLWLLTSEGLLKVNWKDGEVSGFRHNDEDTLSIVRDNILDAVLERQGNIWLASSEGVDLFSPATGKRIPYLTAGATPGGSAAMQLSLDQTGTLWVSTGGGGLYCLSEKSFRFPHFSIGSPGGWPKGFESIERSRNGEFWLCSGGKVFQMDPWTQRIVTSIDVLRGAKGTYGDWNMHSSFLDDKGILWYGIWGPGLYKVDLATQQVKNFRYPDQIDKGDAAVRSIAPGTGDSLWIGAALDGLWKFDPASGRFVRGSKTAFARANDVLKDRHGKVWVATIFEGLYRIDPAIDSVEHFIHDRSNPNSLSNDRTNNLFEDPQGRIWFGAVNVLNLWNPTSRTFTRYPNPAFPNAHTARVIGADRKERLWVSYGDGQLAMLDRSTGRFVNFDVSDGVCGYVIDMENLDDGRVLLSGFGGLNIFDPDSVLRIGRTPPPLAITRMSINDRPVVPPQFLNNSAVLNLSSNEEVIELEFAALDIDAPHLVEYRYKLEGLENEWIDPKGRRYVRYPGLRPGDYVFRVRAVSSRGEWPEQEIALEINIAPPWWLSRWAFGGYFVLMVAIVLAAYRLRLKQLRLKQQAEMEHFQAERLAEVDKLKSRFFANVSHEFRTPLSLILGPVDHLLERVAEADHRQRLHLIKENAGRLFGLVNQLLDFSRIESGMMALQVCSDDVSRFLHRTVMSFQSWAERKRITLEFHADPESLHGCFDPAKLETIVNNLMSNALKFTPEGGTVAASLRGHCEGRSVIASPALAGRSNHLILTISNTGPGIPPEHLPHIFDRFYRADDTHTSEGTGIGLALTKELVDLHHGTITAASTPGKGSVFTVTIPIDRSAYAADKFIHAAPAPAKHEQNPTTLSPETPAPTHAPQPANGKPILLIVEDNADLRSYIREYCEADYTVFEVENGQQGYERALEIGPDIVITDFMMPEMDGLELCRTLKNDLRTSHVPVILLTARADIDSKIGGLDTGADDYITKPFDSRELLARVRNLIEQRRQLRATFSTGVVLRPGEVTVTSLDDALLRKIMDAVEKNMAEENFSVDDLAREACLSRRNLSRKVKALTNLSPADFVQYIRLQRARELLEKNAGSVAEIAFQVGFGNPAYFSKSFRKRFGVAPSEVRNQNP